MPKKKHPFSAAFLLSACLYGFAQTMPMPMPLPERSLFVHPDTSPELSWHAALIASDEPVKPNQWTAFRRTFDLTQLPRQAIARIAVDSKYWLWVNGTLVVREGGLKRGPTPTDTYFDEVDLSRHLKAGTNTIAVLVWHFGKEGFSHKDSGGNGLVFQLDGDGPGNSLVSSDAGWKVRVHPAFGGTGEPHPNYRLPESNIRFDATRDIAGWMLPGYADTAWTPATEKGRAPCAPWNRLVKRPIPLWRDSELKNYVSVSDDPGAPAGQLFKAKLPYNAQVTPYFKIDAPAGLVVDVRTDNYEGGGSPNVRAEYVTTAGVQEFECLGWMNGHVVEYRIPAGVKIIQLGYRETGYATDMAGAFDCDDPFINRLRQKAARTLYLTMRDTYMDCPDRERSQWWGDVVNELGEVFYEFDRSADALTRKGMLELIAWQKPGGVLFSPIPAGNWERDLPMQMLASVGRQGFWTYALYSGDLETLRAVYPGVKRYLEIWDLQPDGLVVARPGAWPWGDWGEDIDMPVLGNAWYHLALQGQRRMAAALGHAEDLPWIDARLASIERGFNRTFWQGHEYRSPDHAGHTDDRANALAVVSGLAGRDKYADLAQVFRIQEHASPYMEKYVLEALCLMDQPVLAQERMKRRYAKMVDHPDYTTLWEGWGVGAEGFGGGTVNHAWSGGALTIMSQYFAGIAPLTPGFSTYQIRPQPGTLLRVSAHVVTAHGAIHMALDYHGESLAMEVDSPAGTKGTVGLPIRPGESVAEVRANGVVVWKNGRAARSVPGLTVVGPVAALSPHLEFEVAPGHWSFTASLQGAPDQKSK